MRHPIENLVMSPEVYDSASQRSIRQAKKNKNTAYFCLTAGILNGIVSVDSLVEGRQFLGIAGLGAAALVGVLSKKSISASNESIRISEIFEGIATKQRATQAVDKTE